VRMSWRKLGLLIVLMVLAVAIIMLMTQLVRSRSGDILQPAVPLTEPVTKDISADRGWQNTGILLESGETIHFQFMAREIRDGEAVFEVPAELAGLVGRVIVVSQCLM
jgi:hypothetical protein